MPLTILADNREQKGWNFTNYPVELHNTTLATGDYAIPQLCDYDNRLDTYEPHFAVERKSGSDFLQSITHSRTRFQDEIKRATGWDEPLMVHVEEPWQNFQNRYSDVLRYRKIYPSQIEGTVNSWQEHYNVDFKFFSSRREAEQATFDALMTAYRAQQYTL